MIHRIDLKTIRSNPEAGRTTFLEPGGPTVTTEVWDDGQTKTIERNGVEVSRLVRSDVRSPQWARKLMSRTQERPIHVVHTIEPAPDYLYEREPLEVKCEGCGSKFDASKLESDCGGIDEGDWWSDEICPKCGKQECLNTGLEHETIGQAMIRLKSENPERWTALNGAK